MQFVDAELDLDPNVTVILGRNDTGKTNILLWFFGQHVKEGVIHGRARPLIEGYRGDPVSFELEWETERGDSDRYPLEDAYGHRDISRILLKFQHESPNRKDYSYLVDGHAVDPYEVFPGTHGPSMREVFYSRKLFPEPYYIGTKPDLRMIFEARFYELAEPHLVIFHPDLVPTEELLLRVAGMYAQTRPLQGRGVEEPWSGPPLTRSVMPLEEIEQRLGDLSARVTALLNRWWDDPPGLTFTIGLPAGGKDYSHRINSYALQCQLRASGFDYYGVGLLWFVRLLVEWLWIQALDRQLLVLIDEPAITLHPRAQRALARFFSALGKQHQLVYSTHSPFIIDWNFPHRIRLLERDPQSRRTLIRNKPYTPGRLQSVWDPLREAIGVSMGDLALVGEKNLLVEGVTDQFLVANASAALERFGHEFLDLGECSIIPFGDIPALKRLIYRAREVEGRVTVICDTDSNGEEIARVCRLERVPVHQVGEFVSGLPSGQDASVEDLIGLEEYARAVNDVYRSFDWFNVLALDSSERRGRSLGRFIKETFEDRFPNRNYDKYSVTVELVRRMHSGLHELAEKFLPLIHAVNSQL